VGLLARRSENELASAGLIPLGRITQFKACLIANRESLKVRDLAGLLVSLSNNLPASVPDSPEEIEPFNVNVETATACQNLDSVRLALPDGHQQAHVRKILDAAGIRISDYPSDGCHRRPVSGLEGFDIKIIRPQDMPLQVACGNYDLAITGRDWLTDHLYQFPTSPVREMMDLKFGRVRIVAVVANDQPVTNLSELQVFCRERAKPLRVASEYINIADKFARMNHLGMYKVIPTWGATEAFLPEDADVLIENTETGSTIARHNLRIIETLFESTACIIGKPEQQTTGLKQQRITAFLRLLGRGVEALA
jgi:ATP phosphoribosyltransferase